MKRSSVSASLVVALLFVPYLLQAAKPITITPTNSKSEKVIIGKKERAYHRLSTKTPLRVEVEGPGTLTILTRLILPDNGPSSQRYTVVVREGKNERSRLSTQTERSSSRLKADKTPLGKLRKLKVKLPAGLYRFDIALEQTSAPGAMTRCTFTRPKGATKQVPIEALSYARVVTALVKEKLLTYYIATKETRVQVRVVGPTKLKITTRLNFDTAMKGKQQFAVNVSEGGKTILRKELATSKALDVVYKEMKDVTPGKAVSFVLTVPAGEHRYTISPDKTTSGSIGLRFAIPETDLGNEE